MFRSKSVRKNYLRPHCVFRQLRCSSGSSRLQADDVPVVEITAKRFAFSPDKITLKKGQTVKAPSSQRRCDARILPATLEDRRRDSRRTRRKRSP